jgi:hypothetical protein
VDPLKGAEILSHRLGSAGAEDRTELSGQEAVSNEAPPLFHWLGVEPTGSSVELPELVQERPRARRRILPRRA